MAVPAQAWEAPPAGVASLVTVLAKALESTGGFSPGNAQMGADAAMTPSRM